MIPPERLIRSVSDHKATLDNYAVYLRRNMNLMKVTGDDLDLIEALEAGAAALDAARQHEEENEKTDGAGLIHQVASPLAETEPRLNTGIPRIPNVWENAAAVAAPHYWTPDPTKRFCVVCGDNDLGSVWGIHRFQIQPGDPDFKPEAK